MDTQRRLGLVLAGLAGGCGELADPAIVEADLGFYVASDVPDRPRLRYDDGQVSLNTTCAVRLENKLNPAIPPVYVNGSPLGFC